MLILAIESSCDETSICIMRSNGSILSHKIASQEIHSKFGGVVPELASRTHLINIQKLYKYCIKESKIKEKNIDLVCATLGPGLIGSLLVGSTFAKSLSIGLKKPFYPINHLEGHILSPSINNKINFPYLCLLLTGGHTQIYLVKGINNYKLMGETIDDAVGEAFDKVAKLLNLPYPGGPSIEKEAKKGNENLIPLPHPLKKNKSLQFSFSGIKTAVNIYVKKNNLNKKLTSDIAASFQNKICQILEEKINLAIKKLEKEKIKINQLAVVGGVASNKKIKHSLKTLIKKHNIQLIIPPINMFGDNAAMIGWACAQKILKNNFKDDIYFKANPRLQIDLIKNEILANKI